MSADFAQAVQKLINQFLDARKNSTISHETDIEDLKRARNDLNQQIERFKKFKPITDGSLL